MLNVVDLPASSICPVCHHELLHAATPQQRKPEFGDFTVCIYCASILRWNQEMRLYLIPPDEYDTLSEERKEELSKTVMVVYQFHKRDVPKKQRLNLSRN